MKKTLLFAIGLFFTTFVFSQQQLLLPPVKWYSFEDALTLNAQRAAYGLPTKKIFIDVYTDWCGFCKRMDAITFSHPVIADMLNRDWIPVKLNAERRDTININNQIFVNEHPGRGPHQLAIVLLKGEMGDPSTVLIDETGRPIQVLQGFKPPTQLEVLLSFFSTNAYRTTEWEEFQKTFRGIIRE